MNTWCIMINTINTKCTVMHIEQDIAISTFGAELTFPRAIFLRSRLRNHSHSPLDPPSTPTPYSSTLSTLNTQPTRRGPKIGPTRWTGTDFPSLRSTVGPRGSVGGWSTSTRMETSDEQLNEILRTHATALEGFVTSLRSELQRGTSPDEGSETASLLKRNTELAAILSYSQKTVAEQEVSHVESNIQAAFSHIFCRFR